MINLFISLYPETNDRRIQDFAHCLITNQKNRLIDRIFILAEGGVHVSDFGATGNRCTLIPVSHRPTYAEYFAEATNAAGPDTISVIANADIYFDETLALALPMRDIDCYALLRYETTRYERPDLGIVGEVGGQQHWGCHYDKRRPGMRHIELCNGSQDAWIFKGPIFVKGADFCPGLMNCDTRIAFQASATCYRVFNPSLSIKCWHVHRDWHERHNEKRLPPGPELFTAPCSLVDGKPDDKRY
jgi:hypothetical protein